MWLSWSKVKGLVSNKMQVSKMPSCLYKRILKVVGPQARPSISSLTDIYFSFAYFTFILRNPYFTTSNSTLKLLLPVIIKADKKGTDKKNDEYIYSWIW